MKNTGSIMNWKDLAIPVTGDTGSSARKWPVSNAIPGARSAVIPLTKSVCPQPRPVYPQLIHRSGRVFPLFSTGMDRFHPQNQPGYPQKIGSYPQSQGKGAIADAIPTGRQPCQAGLRA